MIKTKNLLARVRADKGWSDSGICVWLLVVVFVCLGFFVPLEKFFSQGDDTVTDEELQILIYSGHSRPLSTEGSLACQPYCDMGHPFVMSFPRVSNTCICCQAFDSGLL